VLRLRTLEGQKDGILTYKGKAKEEAGLKSRRELELTVAHGDMLHQVLDGAGFTVALEYPKTREVWRLADDTEVAIDRLPFGYFCEIEGSKSAIQAAAEAVGLALDDAEPDSYAALMERHLTCQAKK